MAAGEELLRSAQDLLWDVLRRNQRKMDLGDLGRNKGGKRNA